MSYKYLVSVGGTFFFYIIHLRKNHVQGEIFHFHFGEKNVLFNILFDKSKVEKRWLVRMCQSEN